MYIYTFGTYILLHITFKAAYKVLQSISRNTDGSGKAQKFADAWVFILPYALKFSCLFLFCLENWEVLLYCSAF